jgi:general secretion pathway protein G
MTCRYEGKVTLGIGKTEESAREQAAAGPDPARTVRGFTLLELLVVLAILALIASFAGPQVIKYLGRAKTDAARVQIGNLTSAIDLYRLEIGHYPSAEQGLRALIEQPSGAENWNGPYLQKRAALNDPWGVAYQYRIPGENNDFDIFTLGADNQEGGEGEDQDLGSW